MYPRHDWVPSAFEIFDGLSLNAHSIRSAAAKVCECITQMQEQSFDDEYQLVFTRAENLAVIKEAFSADSNGRIHPAMFNVQQLILREYDDEYQAPETVEQVNKQFMEEWTNLLGVESWGDVDLKRALEFCEAIKSVMGTGSRVQARPKY